MNSLLQIAVYCHTCFRIDVLKIFIFSPEIVIIKNMNRVYIIRIVSPRSDFTSTIRA